MWARAGKGLLWLLGAAGTLAAFKTKGPGSAGVYDPDHPDSVSGAPPPGGAQQIQDSLYGCETVSGKLCEDDDVKDWLATYQKVLAELSETSHVLASVANKEGWTNRAAQLVQQGNAAINDFNSKYADFQQMTWTPGSQYGEIVQINQDIAASIRIRKSMLREIGLADPSDVPVGLSPTDLEYINTNKDSHAAAYAAGGAILGLGIALAVVVAANKKKARPAV